MAIELGWVGRRSRSVNLLNLIVGMGVVTVSSLGAVMAATNPTQAAYETYATQTAISFLDSNVCAEAPTAFGLKQECKSLLKRHRSTVREFIADNTTVHDFVFFSIYTTELSVTSFAPKYEITAVGAFNHFHVYEALPE